MDHTLGDFAFWLAMGFVGLGLTFGPIGRAFARRLEGRGLGDPNLRQVKDLEARLAEMEQSQARVAELEERLDFAERLLAQSREAGRVGPAGTQ